MTVITFWLSAGKGHSDSDAHESVVKPMGATEVPAMALHSQSLCRSGLPGNEFALRFIISFVARSVPGLAHDEERAADAKALVEMSVSAPQGARSPV